jgi:hypothetical protein
LYCAIDYNHTCVIEEKENPRDECYNGITSRQVAPNIWGERTGIA